MTIETKNTDMLAVKLKKAFTHTFSFHKFNLNIKEKAYPTPPSLIKYPKL